MGLQSKERKKTTRRPSARFLAFPGLLPRRSNAAELLELGGASCLSMNSIHSQVEKKSEKGLDEVSALEGSKTVTT